MKIPLQWIIVAALIGIIILQRACAPAPPAPQVRVDTVTVVKEKHVQIPVKEYVPVPVKHTVHDTLRIPVKVDTTAILKDYYTTQHYRDSARIDTLGYVIIEDDIRENRIQHRKTFGNYTIKIPEKIITITKPAEERNKLFIGPRIGAPLYGGADLTLVTKTDQLYTFGAGLGPSGPMYSLSIGFKIKLKK